MTPSNHTKLIQAEAHHYRTTYPSVPGHCLAKSKYKDDCTNGLTKCIIDYIRFTGGWAERVNTMGRQIRAKSGREIWIRGGGTNGSADIHSTILGMSVQWEVKFGKDKQSPVQMKYAANLIRAGGRYFIVKSFDEFIEYYESLFVKQNILP